jgi:acetyl esterase/lipase
MLSSHPFDSAINAMDFEDPTIFPPLSARKRLSCFISTWALKILYKVASGFVVKLPATSARPTLIKTFPSRPSLPCHVHYPPSYNASSRLLPLYIDIHGGGFVIGTPRDDDLFCSAWAARNDIIVVSINYRPLRSLPLSSQRLRLHRP